MFDMSPSSRQLYKIGDVEVDVARGCVIRSGIEQHLRQKTFQVLVYLLERHEKLVTKDELIEMVWDGMAVTDDALVQCVVDIRKALGDDPRRPHFIKTIPKQGYRFIASLDVETHNTITTIETEEITSVSFEIETENSDPPATKVITENRKALHKSIINSFRSLERKNVFLAASLIVLLVAAASFFFIKNQRAQYSSNDLPALQVAQGKRTVAVMYFENQTGRADSDWLRAGLADMLITNLSRSSQLAVLSRPQLFLLLERAGHDPEEPLRLDMAFDIARRSKAQVVVTGSFAVIGERVRIDVQIHDVNTGQFIIGESLIADRPEQVLTQVDLLSLRIASHLSDGQGAQQVSARTKS